MKISYNWLQEYFEKKLPEPNELGDILTFHSYSVEGIEKINGDYVLDIEILPNRAHDSLSHRGVAKEISTLISTPLKYDPFKDVGDDLKKTVPKFDSKNFINLNIDDEGLCLRATKQMVIGVEIKDSPDWLKERLEVLGQRSINNVVDATNYVMLDIGQPVHAFDFDKLLGSEKKNVRIRKAKKGEKITALDGVEYTLGESMAVISDDEKALDIAGIKGGQISSIDEHTKRVLLSACSFDPVNTRKTSRKLKLATDASNRFQNGVPQELTEIAIKQLSKLVLDIAGGEASENIIYIHPKTENAYKIGISVDDVNKLLGICITTKEIKNIFNRLGFEYKIVKPIDEILKLAPNLEGVPYKYGASVRGDAPKLFDCSSLVNYLYIQAGVFLPRRAIDQYFLGVSVDTDDLKAGDLVFSKGKHPYILENNEYKENEEGVGHVGLMVSKDKIIHACGDDCGNKVVIEDYKKAIKFSGKDLRGSKRIFSDSTERFVVTIPFERMDLRMRVDLIEEVGRIYGYKNIEAKLPEVTKTAKINKKYYYTNKIKNFFVEEGFSEVYTYSLVDEGDVEIENPLASDKNFLRKSLRIGLNKALQQNIKNKPLLEGGEIKIFEIGNVFIKDKERTALGIGYSGSLKYIKEVIARLSEILGVEGIDGNPLTDGKENIFETYFFDELIDKLPPPPNSYEQFDKTSQSVVYSPISVYPFMLRDIAVWVADGKTSDEILNVIKKEAGELLINTKLFDEFKKGDKISYAFNLVFQSREKTLSDEEVNKIMKSVTDIINSNVDWQVR